MPDYKVHFVNRLKVYLILLVANCVWLIDRATGPFAEFLTKLTLKISAAFASALLFLVIFLSVKYGYLSSIADGVVANASPSYSNPQSHDVLGSTSVFASYPQKTTQVEVPVITAKSAIVIDKKTGKTLYEKEPNLKLAPASTTKLMTALVAIDIYQPNETITISKQCAEVDSTKANLPEGTEYRVLDLINAMLVASSGDASCALAEQKITPGEFVAKMNKKAQVLGMFSTYFTNEVGLDGENGSHHSTAKDLLKLANAAMEKNQIKNAVKQKEFLIKSIDEKHIAYLENTNKLLNEVPQTVGIKTGKTTEAGEVLIYEYLDKKKDLVIIVMGSEDRFTDVRALLFWVLGNFRWM